MGMSHYVQELAMKCISRVGFGSALVVVMLAVSPAVSQSFLDRGKDLLKGLGGRSTPDVSSLSVGEIASGLKDALRVGSERVVSSLSRADGFNKASDVHIPLPGSLKTVQSMLNKVGMGSLTDDLELRLNRGAEAAVTKASKLFGNAIAQMTIEHAKAILNGPKDSATKYFQSKMSGSLMGEMKPIVDSQLSQVGAIASYFKVIGQYKTIPVVPDVKANLINHVLEKNNRGRLLVSRT
jgi:hypothetical protein